MLVFAYCMRRVAGTVHRATGTFPVTCPPFDADVFDPRVFESVDMIWIGLHGFPSQPDALFGDEMEMPGVPIPIRTPALYVDRIEELDLEGKLVFATTCFFTETNFPQAFKTAGARVIGGPGENYGDTERLVGADKLGSMLVQAVSDSGLKSLAHTLEVAKHVLGYTKADRDAREFSIL